MMMADDATPEELWQRLAEESPHTSDEEIERLFIAAAKDNEDFIRQITEWGFLEKVAQTAECVVSEGPTIIDAESRAS